MFISKKKFIISDFLNIALGLIPASYMAGNLVLNLNGLIIFFLGFWIFRFELFKLKKNIFNFFLIFFFVYLILTTFFNNYTSLEIHDLYKENIIKSFLFFRYLLIFLVINKMAEKNILDLKYLFLISTILLSILTFDLFFQFIFGYNLLGNEPIEQRLSSFFSKELIAGGYLQIFSFFMIFSIPLIFSNKNNKYLKYYILSAVFLIFTAILVTNNRMPLLLFLLSFFIFTLMEKDFRKYLIIFIFSCVVTFFIAQKLSPSMYDKYYGFYKRISYMIVDTHGMLSGKIERYVFKINNENIYEGGYLRSEHLRLFYTAAVLSEENLVFGHGLKSFRLICRYEDNYNYSCSNHPHNYFVELLLDTGLIGLLSVCIVLGIAIRTFLKVYSRKKKGKIIDRLFLLPSFLTLCTIAFPLKSSGSFFTTNNAFIIFIMLALVINVKNLKMSSIKK